MGQLGVHVSIQGGLSEAVTRGERLGCEAIQIFTRNQRQWQAAPLHPDHVQVFRDRLAGSIIRSVVVHGSYLMNLASPDAEQLEKSITVLLDEIGRADQLGIPYFVFHPGSHRGTGEAAGLNILIASLNQAVQLTPNSNVRLLIENTAGTASMLGGRFEQFQIILESVDQPERFGICFDTAHAYAAGYPLDTLDDIKRTFEEMDRTIGTENLHVFHVNDSKTVRGSCIDRHEHIGQGCLGFPIFRYLVNAPAFFDCPIILETPGDETEDRRNLQVLKRLRED